MVTIEKIKKLHVEEKKRILDSLLADTELQSFENVPIQDAFLFEELARRDEAMKKGDIKLISLDEFENRLATRRNAL